MKIIVVNDDPTRSVEVDTIQVSDDPHGEPGHKLVAVTKQGTIKLRDHAEFWLHDSKYVTVKEL